MNNKTPSLSIIMPVYNVERYLREAVDSVIAQTFTDWELILIDDGSPDNCPAICDSYAAADPRIRVIHKANGGVSVVRNAGIAAAKGNIIGFVDSDDTIEPEMYSKMIDALEAADADAAICGYRFKWRNRDKTKLPQLGNQVIHHAGIMKALLENKEIESYLWDKIYRRHVINADMPAGAEYEDLAVMHHWMHNVEKLAVVAEPLYNYRMRRSSIVYKPSAKTRIDRIRADIDRVDFYRLHPVNGISQGELAASVVKGAVGAAKHIARYCKDNAVIKSSFNEIIDLSKNYFDIASKSVTLPAKTRRRYERLCKHPLRFMLTMRMGRLFQPSRLKKENDRFE